MNIFNTGATLPQKVVVTSGVASIWCQGRHDDRGAEGASIEAPSGVGYGEGCRLASRLGGLEERREPRPLSQFLQILGHRTLLVARKIRFSCPKYKEKLVFFI